MSLYIFCAVVILSGSLFLIAHHDYEDGIIGRLALGMLVVAEWAVLNDFFTERTLEPSNASIILQLGMGMFLSRHIYRFVSKKYRSTISWEKALK